MSKRVHPICLLRRSLEKKHYLRRVIWPPTNQKIEADIARHVKPLLDALEALHGKLKDDHEYCGPEEGCVVNDACRLLAAWKESIR